MRNSTFYSNHFSAFYFPCDTVKGKGLPFAEGLVSSHSMNVGADELEAGLAALN